MCATNPSHIRREPEEPYFSVALPAVEKEDKPTNLVVERDPSLVSLTFTTVKGEKVTLHYKHNSRSIGKPNQGGLKNGKCIPKFGKGYIHVGEANCGTDETVTILMFAINEVLKEYPDTAPIVIGALSKPDGGRHRPHKSHRSGRDVDIGFYRKDNRPQRSFEPIHPSEVDWDKTFFLLANMISTGKVQYVFVNHSISPFLYEAAERMGYDEEQLSYLFQYPRGRKEKVGIIRHARGHTRHMHVRFVCPEGDDQCINE